jgi:peptidoglycan hydrolase CwlO-like protein
MEELETKNLRLGRSLQETNEEKDTLESNIKQLDEEIECLKSQVDNDVKIINEQQATEMDLKHKLKSLEKARQLD